MAATQMSIMDPMTARALCRGKQGWFRMAHGRHPAIPSWTAATQGLGFPDIQVRDRE